MLHGDRAETPGHHLLQGVLVELHQAVVKFDPETPRRSTRPSGKFLVEGSQEVVGKVQTTPQNRFETTRPGRNSERFLKRTLRWVEQKRCLTWSADFAQVRFQARPVCNWTVLERKVAKACCERLQTT